MTDRWMDGIINNIAIALKHGDKKSWFSISHCFDGCQCKERQETILGNPGVTHYVTLHSSPLGQLTDKTSFSMNIHTTGECLNS